MKSPREGEMRGRYCGRTVGEVQRGQLPRAGYQEHVMLLIMGEGLTRWHRKFLSIVVELQISVLHKNNKGTFTLLFVLKDCFSRTQSL